MNSTNVQQVKNSSSTPKNWAKIAPYTDQNCLREIKKK